LIYGAYLARIAIPSGLEVRVEQTGANKNHYSIFETAEVVFGFFDGEIIQVDADIRSARKPQ
jgi:hypothetical protein